MKPTNDGGEAAAVPARHITPGPPGEAFYSTEYLKLVKILVVIDATVAEAQDAAQKALKGFFERSSTAPASISNPARLCLPGGNPVLHQGTSAQPRAPAP
jgi:hypothetical protein